MSRLDCYVFGIIESLLCRMRLELNSKIDSGLCASTFECSEIVYLALNQFSILNDLYWCMQLVQLTWIDVAINIYRCRHTYTHTHRRACALSSDYVMIFVPIVVAVAHFIKHAYHVSTYTCTNDIVPNCNIRHPRNGTFLVLHTFRLQPK